MFRKLCPVCPCVTPILRKRKLRFLLRHINSCNDYLQGSSNCEVQGKHGNRWSPGSESHSTKPVSLKPPKDIGKHTVQIQTFLVSQYSFCHHPEAEKNDFTFKTARLRQINTEQTINVVFFLLASFARWCLGRRMKLFSLRRDEKIWNKMTCDKTMRPAELFVSPVPKCTCSPSPPSIPAPVAWSHVAMFPRDQASLKWVQGSTCWLM